MGDPSLTQIVALVAFAGTHLGLAIGHLPLFRVDRTGVAIIGAALMAAGLVRGGATSSVPNVEAIAKAYADAAREMPREALSRTAGARGVVPPAS